MPSLAQYRSSFSQEAGPFIRRSGAVPQRPNFGGEGRASLRPPFSHAPFPIAVGHVLRMSSKPQMTWIATGPIVTAVEHVESVWNRSIGQNPPQDMRPVGPVSCTHLRRATVALFAVALPFLARVGSARHIEPRHKPFDRISVPASCIDPVQGSKRRSVPLLVVMTVSQRPATNVGYITAPLDQAHTGSTEIDRPEWREHFPFGPLPVMTATQSAADCVLGMAAPFKRARTICHGIASLSGGSSGRRPVGAGRRLRSKYRAY